jgi:hypothetical protein
MSTRETAAAKYCMTAYAISDVYIEVTVVARVWTGEPPPGSDVGVTVIVVVMTWASLVVGYAGGRPEVLGCGWVVVE